MMPSVGQWCRTLQREVVVDPPLPNKLNISCSLAIPKALILEAASLRLKRRIPLFGSGGSTTMRRKEFLR
jgi:hypothetical protein